jgi:hypothetical protein
MSDYDDFKRDQDRWFDELEQGERDRRRLGAAAACERERRRLEQIDKRIDGLWGETLRLGHLVGMSGLVAAKWASDMVQEAKRMARRSPADVIL